MFAPAWWDCSHLITVTGNVKSSQCPATFSKNLVLATWPSRSCSSSASDAGSGHSHVSEFLCKGSTRNSPKHVHTRAFVTALHLMAGMELRRGAELLGGDGQVSRASELCSTSILERLICGRCEVISPEL